MYRSINSTKAKIHLMNNVDTGGEVIPIKEAIRAVRIAEKEMKEAAVRVLSQLCPHNYNGRCTSHPAHLCRDTDCRYKIELLTDEVLREVELMRNGEMKGIIIEVN